LETKRSLILIPHHHLPISLVYLRTEATTSFTQRLVAAKIKVITKIFTHLVVILASLVLTHRLHVRVQAPVLAQSKYLPDPTLVLNIMNVTVHVRFLGFVRFLSRAMTLTLSMKMADYKIAVVRIEVPLWLPEVVILVCQNKVVLWILGNGVGRM
jgi:hypothetical protein